VNGYYITASSSAIASNLDGVGKKVKTQIDNFNSFNISIKYFHLYNKISLLSKLKRKFLSSYYNYQLPGDFYTCNFFYIRKFMFTRSFIGLLKNIRKKTNAKILLELPTYPYDSEIPSGINYKLTLLQDKILRKKIYKYIDRIVTYSLDDEIFKVKTIKINNGINCSQIPVRSYNLKNNSLKLIAVANFSKWHGYDRLIHGLYNYYQNNPKNIVNIYFAGEGDDLPFYKQLTEQYGLSEYVFFEGFVSGSQLDSFFENADIGLCSIGCHRKNIFLSSELKSREYLTRGIPMVSSTKIDVLPEGFPYCHYVSEDDSPIDIQSIINFYNNLTSKYPNNDISSKIRQFAIENCDISKTMLPVVNYLKENIISI